MNVVIACGAMPFGPTTLEHKSLGGSETAALMLGKELAKRGHQVKMFCNLPQGGPDAFAPGHRGPDSVVYYDLSAYSTFVTTYPSDLVIVVRDPGLAAQFANTRKKVLWMHDIATKRGMQRAFDQMAWAIDEVWTVSEFHRQQVHAATGYPLSHIVPLRNGIVPVKTEDFGRLDKQLVYAARPERGLDNLIMPGGIMEQLPDYNLVVCMYDHFPEHMRPYYEQIFARMRVMPNVEFRGSLPQSELRQLIRNSAAYIYPTQFEETSCILARECIEQGTPMLTTRVGALPETLGDCGIYFEDWLAHTEPYAYSPESVPVSGTPEWCKLFAYFVRDRLIDQSSWPENARFRMYERTDLYWDGVAQMVETCAQPRSVSPFSRAWSLLQDGDVIAAKAYLDEIKRQNPEWEGELPLPLRNIEDEIYHQYPFISGMKSMQEHYDWVYEHKAGTEQSELHFSDAASNMRIDAISDELRKLKPGSRVLEYGCGVGHLLAPLAKRFPQLDFVGVDIAKEAIGVLNNGAMAGGYKNLRAYIATVHTMDGLFEAMEFDAAIISEVLEHVVEPWNLAHMVEGYVVEGGRILITTPYGPWEVLTFRQPGRFHERAHIWHLDTPALAQMFGAKPNFYTCALSLGVTTDGRAIGNTLCAYDVDGDPRTIHALDPYEKALAHNSRQTAVACVIAYNNEDTILKMLNSIKDDVAWVNIAHGPSTDRTRELLDGWFAEHPWIGHEVIDVPKIAPRDFGFDDARIASLGVQANWKHFDWMLWIDTDEYLSGNFAKFLRANMLNGYIVPQHHFTCSPRGGEPQIDRPARLIRTRDGYVCRGHVHEHFEIPGEAVGRCWMLPDVDIGHTGYVNEDVRKRRFERNFEFLKWDHESDAQRPLHKFLWFRDIVHRMRIEQAHNRMPQAIALAREGIAYYNEHWKDMLTFGQGLHMSVGYASECMNFLGIGVPLKIMFGVDDKTAQIAGTFESYEQAQRILAHVLEPEFKDRTSRYW